MKAMYNELYTYAGVCGVESEKYQLYFVRVLAVIGCAISVLIICGILKLGYLPATGGGHHSKESFTYGLFIFLFFVAALSMAHVFWLTVFGELKFKMYVIAMCAMVPLVLLGMKIFGFI